MSRDDLLAVMNAYCDADMDDDEKVANGIVAFVAEWLDAFESRDNPSCRAAGELWREDMA